jgi:hypothetical protein
VFFAETSVTFVVNPFAPWQRCGSEIPIVPLALFSSHYPAFRFAYAGQLLVAPLVLLEVFGNSFVKSQINA